MPAPIDPAADPIAAADLVLATQRASRLVTHALTETLAPLTALEGELLTLLSRRGATATSELLVATGLRSSTLTSGLDRLHDRKLIVRQVRPDDRRSFLVMLTEDGKVAAATAAAAMASAAAVLD